MQRLAYGGTDEIDNKVAGAHLPALHQQAVQVIAQMQRGDTHAFFFEARCIGATLVAKRVMRNRYNQRWRRACQASASRGEARQSVRSRSLGA